MGALDTLTRRLALVALGLSALPNAPQAAAPTEPERWPSLSSPPKNVGGGEKDAAVVVGIEEYLDLPRIAGATQNANDWYAELTESRKVPETRVLLLRNRQATSDAMLEAARKVAGQVKPGGTLWFVFVGHGAAWPDRTDPDGVLVGVNAVASKKDLYNASLRQRDLLGAVKAQGGAETVMVLDACFSGRTPDGCSLLPGEQFTVPASFATVAKTTILAAGAPNETAGALPASADARPAFSSLVLGGLQGWADGAADDVRDGKVSLNEALRFSRKALRTLDPTREQTPDLTGNQQHFYKSGGLATPSLARLNIAGGGIQRREDPKDDKSLERAIEEANRLQAQADAAAGLAREQAEAEWAQHLERVEKECRLCRTRHKRHSTSPHRGMDVLTPAPHVKDLTVHGRRGSPMAGRESCF